MSELYIGLMSGTSLDGVDAVLVDFAPTQPRVLGHCSAPFPAELKAEFHALNRAGNNELHRAALAGNGLARLYAAQVDRLLLSLQLAPNAVIAVGAHGQTVRHRPQEFDDTGYTLQINQPALLAELCGIDVVADFRSRDVAAGGQGAPLVPPFHQAFFGEQGHAIAVLNVGGIANISVLGGGVGDSGMDDLVGYDCGPGNTLLDAWCEQHTGQAFDAGGAWAAGGKVHPGLLQSLQQEPYFALAAPKSTGRDLFNMLWLGHHLGGFAGVPAQDVQATLTELTAWSCATAVLAQATPCTSLIVCGGGALNAELMRCLQAHLPGCEVRGSDRHGLPPLQVEATAFAWLAQQTIQRKKSSTPKVTGARGARVLGAVYPA